MAQQRSALQVKAAPARRAPQPAAPASRAALARSSARALQRRLGNQGSQVLLTQLRSVQRRAQSGASETEVGLRLSSPADLAEKEAEATAKQVMRSAAAPVSGGADGAIQRKEGGPATVPAAAAAQIAASGSGAPLPGPVRAFMEPRFRADFSQVRIHTDLRAAQLSAQLNAQAFTIGHQVFFGKDQFRPDSPAGQELIAHELTHTIQQGAAVQRRAAPTVSTGTALQVQRSLLPGPLEYAASMAEQIPGFRMLTIVLGFNPITMAKAERNAANLLRALLELLPGGKLLTQALDQSGAFDKAGAWVEVKLRTLGMAASAIRQAVSDFMGSVGLTDLGDLGGVWERAKHVVTGPIDRIVKFGTGLIGEIVQFVKDALLKPMAGLAEKLPGWMLLTAVLQKNPLTGEPVARTADTVIGGFMKLIGQEDVWENMKKANAVARAWTWFQAALGGLKSFAGQLPGRAMDALRALTLEDIVLLPRAFGKVAAVFGGVVAEFMAWAGKAVWDLLEIVVDAVSPGAFGYIKRTGAALKRILKNPLPFVGNLVRAAKLGFQNFAGGFLGHLKAGLLEWLTGAMPGVYVPQAFALGEIVKFAFSVLGISWQNIRQKLVKAVGEPAVAAMEAGFDVVTTLVKEGPAAAWEKIKDQLAEMQQRVLGGIIDFVVDLVVMRAVPKLISMFIPGAGFVSAILSIYETIMVFVNKIAKMVQVVKGFIDSIVAIAGGAIGAAASKVEATLAGVLSLAINFFAGFVGLGKVSDKVMGVIGKVRATIDKALDALVNWIVSTAKKLFAKAFGKRTGSTGERGTESTVKTFKLGTEQHTLTAVAKGRVLTITMSSSQPLALETRIYYAIKEMDTEKWKDSPSRHGVLSTLNRANDLIKKFGADFYTIKPSLTREKYMELKLAEVIVLLSEVARFELPSLQDVVTVGGRRYIPRSIFIRDQLYPKGKWKDLSKKKRREYLQPLRPQLMALWKMRNDMSGSEIDRKARFAKGLADWNHLQATDVIPKESAPTYASYDHAKDFNKFKYETDHKQPIATSWNNADCNLDDVAREKTMLDENNLVVLTRDAHKRKNAAGDRENRYTRLVGPDFSSIIGKSPKKSAKIFGIDFLKLPP